MTAAFPMSLSRPLGATGLSCHPLGFGCYRIAAGDQQHADALDAYLDRGGNLIDTSANYMDGDSEVLVGQALRRRPRSSVIVVTKGGYIQGRNMALARERNFPEVVRYADGLWHAIHPEFLETQVRLSAERMQLDSIDVYLLHNPEYYLEHIAHRRPLEASDHEEFYRRLREAFRFLESEVEKGRIRWYGVSSNNYPLPASAAAHTSVARTLAAAESLSADHHFRVVQFPLNLYEAGSALQPANDGQTVLEFCRGKGIGTLANRPLNAADQNRLVRLADFAAPGTQPSGPHKLRELLAPLAAHEEKLARGTQVGLMGHGLAASLLDIVPRLTSAAQWEQVVYPHVIRPVQDWLGRCRQRLAGSPDWQPWEEEFARLLHAALQEIQQFLAAIQQATSDRVRARLAQAGYPPSGESLSRLALNVLLGLEGLTSTLVGMRRLDYVEDAMGAVALDRVDSLGILKRF